jgi:hypothetical protein
MIGAASLRMIAVTCQHCSARYKLSDDLYEKKGVGFGVIVTCRHCKAEIFVRRPGETSVPPLAGTGAAPAIPRAPRAPAPDSVPPPALPLTRRKRAPARLGPPTTDGAELPEVVVDLSDLETADAADLEPEGPPRSRSPVPVAPSTTTLHDEQPARGRGTWFAVLALLGAGSAGVFGFMLRGAMPASAPSSPRLDETPVRALEPPGATTPEPDDVPVDDRAEGDGRAQRPLARPNPAAKAKREGADETEVDAADAAVAHDAGSDETGTELAAESEPREPAGPFDRTAANAALGRAASEASACRRDGDPSGMAAVTITYSPSGRVTTATIAGPPFSGTPTGGRIAATFRKAAIPPFSGELVTVKKTVTIQ